MFDIGPVDAQDCSAEVHHGEAPTDLKSLALFMADVWLFFLRLVRDHRGFETKTDFLAELDRIKYSGR